MRNVFVSFFLLFTIALAAPDIFADFIPAVVEEPAQSNDTIAEGSLELVKRQGNSCAAGYAACSNLNAPGLCCRTNQICSADAANHVACCPINAACTGTIAPVNPGQTASPTSTPFVIASTTTSGVVIGTNTADPTFVQTGDATGRSMVPNSFYPIAFIPTTYTNAAACSSAYTSCQADAASCTAALANGAPGVTVSAPNGGATITAIASLGSSSASQICSSLSQLACSGLVVEACAAFGNGGGGGQNTATRRCGDIYKVGAGIAVGIAGQLLR